MAASSIAERTDSDTSMSPEFYTIIAVSVAMSGLILNGQRATSTALRELRSELHEHREQTQKEIAALGERVARLEGLLEGLRDAITGRAA